MVVVIRFSAHESHGPADHGVADGDSQLTFRLFAQVGQDAGDEVFEAVAPAEDIRGRQSAAGQVGLERLNQPSFRFSSEVLLDGDRAGPRLDGRAPALLHVFQVQKRTIRFRLAALVLEPRQRHIRSAGCETDRAIGGSKIDSDRGAAGDPHRQFPRLPFIRGYYAGYPGFSHATASIFPTRPRLRARGGRA